MESPPPASPEHSARETTSPDGTPGAPSTPATASTTGTASTPSTAGTPGTVTDPSEAATGLEAAPTRFGDAAVVRGGTTVAGGGTSARPLDDTTVPDDVAVDARAVARLGRVTAELESLARLEWYGASGDAVLDTLEEVEQARRRLEAVRARATAAAEADGRWALDGSRALATWLQFHTGAQRGACLQQVRNARRLNLDLPGALEALTDGRIGADHVAVLVRECTRTQRMRRQLADPDIGETFLVTSASRLDAGTFTSVAKEWAIAADPDAADRAWREDGAKEDVTLAHTIDGYHLQGWLDEASGRILDTALTAHMGRASEADDRTPGQRRAAALTELAQADLDSGRLQPSARIRPQITLHVPWETLQALIAATASARPRSGGCTGALGERPDDTEWARQWGRDTDDEHLITTRLDHRRMRGVDPATFSDGTPLTPGQLSRLACDSQISRVVFGPASTVLDVGREQRIFPANQARAVIARDRHCQFPGCHEPPEYGEIHHSLWWAKHNGPTSVGHGILLCWSHHDLVHQREITIARRDGRWHFTRHGLVITAPEHSRRVDDARAAT
nr:HNH endonuclease signature motif containing protein [Pseudactinotalea sp. HY160]